ncbi:Reverse transcriptase (RNA-dependent DNA polymerase) [Popillia japonica]|uniref:Reverse transcriptase (RNA-dependent DNA polymerase) n=1 Tax=Popillia japonica TaxID=7064 RepID=A0AAW1JIX9_POPJA
MPRHLISDAHEWINEIPTVPTHTKEERERARREFTEAALSLPKDGTGIVAAELVAIEKGCEELLSRRKSGWIVTDSEGAIGALRKWKSEDRVTQDIKRAIWQGEREAIDITIRIRGPKTETQVFTGSDGPDDPAFTIAEIREVLRNTKPKKAPGKDGFPAWPLKKLFETLGDKWANILNRCMEAGVFPEVWKVAEVVWIPKPGGKATDGPPGKRGLAGPTAMGQWGRRRGTVDAVENLVSRMKEVKRRGNHCVVVLLDIKNAFNAAWHPEILERLRETRRPGNLYRVIESFLKNRIITCGNEIMRMERGCPHGSSLGPALWLLNMQGWFNKLQDMGGEVFRQAYGDDQVILIEAPSVKKIEATWREVWSECLAWAKEAKVEYSTEKTECLFSWARSSVRPPVLIMGDSPLQVRDNAYFPGPGVVSAHRQLNFVEHTKQARNRLTGMVRNIAVVAGRRWGVGTETRRLVYARVVEPIALYGAEVWDERAHDSRVRRHLAAAQRPFLLGITRAFRTVANSALRVLSGVPPLHIRAEKLYKKRVLTRDQNLNKIEAKKRFDAEELQNWQEEWAEERTGRPTHLVLPKVARGWLGFSERAVQRNGPKNEREDPHIWSFPRSSEEVEVRGQSHAGYKESHLAGRKRGHRHHHKDKRPGPKTETQEADRAAKKARDRPQVDLETYCNKAEVRQKFREKELTKWQSEWGSATTGRGTYRVFPAVTDEWPGLNERAVQLVTGHGYFKAYYRRFKLREGSGLCECGEAEETADHVWWECTVEERERARREFTEAVGTRADERQKLSEVHRDRLISELNKLADAIVRDDSNLEQ